MTTMTNDEAMAIQVEAAQVAYEAAQDLPCPEA